MLERTDFQGFPVISDDKSVVNYATASFMPFSDSDTTKERAILINLLQTISKDHTDFHKEINERLKELDSIEKNKLFTNALPYFRGKSGVYKYLADYLSENGPKSEQPITVIFDEVDKAPYETNQPLLEFLQFCSINGRKLNVKSCILTANLPDENAHSNNISHAISKRCMSFKLNIVFEQWLDWAFKNGVHEYITQYLSSDNMAIYEKAPDGDPTAYALPAPRTWTQAGKSLTDIDNDKNYEKLKPENLDRLRMLAISGNVGTSASAKFEAWFKYYREFDPAIKALVEDGTFPEEFLNKNGRNLKEDQEKLIIAIAACSRHAKEIKEDNRQTLKKVTKNVYGWLVTQKEEHQIAACRMSMNLTSEEQFQRTVGKHELLKIKEFWTVIDMLNKKFRAHGINTTDKLNKH